MTALEILSEKHYKAQQANGPFFGNDAHAQVSIDLAIGFADFIDQKGYYTLEKNEWVTNSSYKAITTLELLELYLTQNP